MKTVFIVIAALVVLSVGCSSVLAGSGAEKAAVSASRTWLTLIDSGSYAASWNQASTYFKGAISEEKWTASLEGGRRPLGKLLSRKVIKTQEADTLPGAPDGKYVIITCRSAFAKKKSAVETVIFMLDSDNTWRAAGYFMK